MSLTEKEIFTLISFDHLGFKQKFGQFDTEEEAQQHAEQLDYTQNKVFGWGRQFFIIHHSS